MVSINCAALPDTLLDSELFGYERGAFTGAHAAYPGQISLACGGTLFLNEIGAMPLHAQAKLLRVIETREVFPIGALRSRHVLRPAAMAGPAGPARLPRPGRPACASPSPCGCWPCWWLATAAGAARALATPCCCNAAWSRPPGGCPLGLGLCLAGGHPAADAGGAEAAPAPAGPAGLRECRAPERRNPSQVVDSQRNALKNRQTSSWA